jgi:hypothetical protein
MAELLLETNNPLDIEPDELRALAEEVSGQTGISAQVAYEDQYGAGVTLHEVLYLWLPSASFVKDAIYTQVLNMAFKFMRARFRKPHGKARPKSIVVLDEDGRELESYDIKTEEGEPRRSAGKGKHRRTRPPVR